MKPLNLIIAFLFCVSITDANSPDDSLNMIGKWKWIHIINSETNEISGIEMLTMGMSKEVSTEFKADSVYIEYKDKLNGDGFSENKGLWYIDKGKNALMMKPKTKWMESKIIYHSKDSIVIEMMKPMNLLMIKED